jgi:long-chain acyl-CoA synthetase
MSVNALIERTVAVHANRTALIELGPGADRLREITYRELYDRVSRARAALTAAGMRKGDRLAVLLDNSIDMVTTEWVCLLSGFLWVALNTRSSHEEHRAILDDCEPAVLVAAHRYAATASRLCDARVTRLLVSRPMTAHAAGGRPPVEPAIGRLESWDDFVANADADPPDVRVAPTDPVRIRYTSGTAGKPKGALLTRACYDASVENVSRVIEPLTADDVLLHVAPMTHASGAMWLPHAAAGAKAVLVESFDAEVFDEIVERTGATAVFLVPTMLVRVIEHLSARSERRQRRGGLAEACETLRTIVYGGASMPVDRLVRGLELLGPVFVQIYGLTESTWPVTALLREEHPRREAEGAESWHRRLASCGKPTPVGELRIVDSDEKEVAVGEVGEIHVRGRNTMAGYWNATADVKGLDSAGWMHTGDVGRRDPEGNITIVDRLHDMIVSGGFNVYPREVEDALSSHPAVLEVAVVGRPDPEWGESVHAFVVLRPGANVAADELVEHCRSTLAGYKKPRGVTFVEALPKNASGKVLRRSLRDGFQPG